MKKTRALSLTALTLFLASGMFSVAPNALQVKAEESVSQSVESSSEEVLSEEVLSYDSEISEQNVTIPQDIVKKASDWIENKVIPLLGGVSVFTVITFIVGLFTTFKKLKGDKNNSIMIEAQNAVINELKAKYDKSEELLLQYDNALKTSLQYMEQMTESSKSIVEQLELQNVKIDNVGKMKDVIDASVTLTAKSFALSDVAVKSGIAQDAQRLVESLKGGNSDGEEG